MVGGGDGGWLGRMMGVARLPEGLLSEGCPAMHPHLHQEQQHGQARKH